MTQEQKRLEELEVREKIEEILTYLINEGIVDFGDAKTFIPQMTLQILAIPSLLVKVKDQTLPKELKSCGYGCEKLLKDWVKVVEK